MGKKTVMFKSPNEIEDFANRISKYPYDMDLKRGRFVVDAKSVLSIISLGMNTKVELKVYEDDDENLGKVWRDIHPYLTTT
ncbi:MAG: HPr family phosphocarrier protein [Suipraeoptans sp.]